MLNIGIILTVLILQKMLGKKSKKGKHEVKENLEVEKVLVAVNLEEDQEEALQEEVVNLEEDQEEVVQEEVAQEEVVQEEVAQEEVVQEKVAQVEEEANLEVAEECLRCLKCQCHKHLLPKRLHNHLPNKLHSHSLLVKISNL